MTGASSAGRSRCGGRFLKAHPHASMTHAGRHARRGRAVHASSASGSADGSRRAGLFIRSTRHGPQRSARTCSIVRGVTAADDPVLADLLRLIKEHGWAVRHVGEGTGPGHASFSYTVGLTALGHAEVVVTGLPFNHALTFLNNIGADVRAGSRFPPGLVTDDLTGPGAPVAFLAVTDTSGLTAVEQVYGDVQAVQMVWPDSSGRLPWTEGHNNPSEAQPLLGLGPLT
jgi:hypothetical protein